MRQKLSNPALQIFTCLVLTSCLYAFPILAADKAINLAELSLPQGFTISLVSDEVPNARQMALSAGGILYVGTRKAGKVYALLPRKGPGKGPGKGLNDPEVVVIAQNLTMPSGVVILDGDLYVGALDRVLKYPNIDKQLQNSSSSKPITEVLSENLPDKTHHGWKYLSAGPDGYLYVPVGAPCNICLSDNPVFASIQRMDPESGTMSTYAEGIRNTVGMAWHPETDRLWFTDNGRDMLGDDIPAEEVNEVRDVLAHYGYPYIHAGDISDPEFGKGKNAEDYVRPRYKIQAHSAALGISFYTGQQFPDQYRNALFIAEHGSWNRTEKVGYRVSVLRWEAGQKVYEPFISGWLNGDTSWGRPNDVLVSPEGDLLISDDQAGAIYRVSYTP